MARSPELQNLQLDSGRICVRYFFGTCIPTSTYMSTKVVTMASTGPAVAGKAATADSRQSAPAAAGSCQSAPAVVDSRQSNSRQSAAPTVKSHAREVGARVGAPGNVPSSGLDVAADLLQIGNRRAEAITIGKHTDAAGVVTYNGVTVVNNSNPLRQPDVNVGSANTLGPLGVGSTIAVEGRTVSIIAFDDATSTATGLVNIQGDVKINGKTVAAPAYLEAKSAGAAGVLSTSYVLFPTTQGNAGNITVTPSDTFNIPEPGSYEITWRVTTTGAGAPEFAWELAAGTITFPIAATGLTPLTTTTSSLPAAGAVTGQVIVTVATAPVQLKLRNNSGVTLNYYNSGNNVAASVIIRRISA